MSSGSHNSYDHSGSSSQHSSSSYEYLDASQKRRRKDGSSQYPHLVQGSNSSQGTQISRPHSTAPGAAGSGSATRYRPILPAPAAPPRPKQAEPAFVHGPTNLPPEPYRGEHPYAQKPQTLNIHRTAAERLPRLEARINRFENALEKYIDHRTSQALERSHLPGTSSDRGAEGGSGSK